MTPARLHGSQPRPRVHPTGVAFYLVVALIGAVLVNPPASAAGPSLVITSPADNAVVGNGTPVIVTFLVSNFVLVQPGRVGQIVSPTEGYLDVYVDGLYARLVTQVEPLTFPVPSGPHTILLRLVEVDGTPLSPDVSASVHVVATEGPAGGIPAITIITPVEGQATGHDVYVFVSVSNFAVVDAYGQPNAPNEGHIQLLRSGIVQQDLGPSDFGFLVDLPDANNTITARLVNNDNTPLSPAVSVSVTIWVKPAADPAPTEVFTGGISLLLGAVLIVLIHRRRKAAARILRERASKP